jgi:hypothetical protein
MMEAWNKDQCGGRAISNGTADAYEKRMRHADGRSAAAFLVDAGTRTAGRVVVARAPATRPQLFAQQLAEQLRPKSVRGPRAKGQIRSDDTALGLTCKLIEESL